MFRAARAESRRIDPTEASHSMSQDQSEKPPARGATAEREARDRAKPHAQIVLLRHGEPEWSVNGGPAVSDPKLTPFGVWQAAASARVLAAEQQFDALYVSPHRRARETAAPLIKATGIEPVIVDPLAEVGVAVEGFSAHEADRYFVEGSQRPLQEHWEGWPEAETFHDFHERVTTGITDILLRHSCRAYREHDFTVWDLPEEKPSIAIVAHMGTNAVILTHLLDIRPVPWEWLRFETGLAAYSILQARPIGPKGYVWSLLQFDREDHLIQARLR
jgi:broad specificity phosphatase PhoE